MGKKPASSKTKPKAGGVKIKAIYFETGYAESASAAGVFVHWTGKTPFDNPEEAVRSFVKEVHKLLGPEEPKPLAPCCTETLSRITKAKACPHCGSRLNAPRSGVDQNDIAEFLKKANGMDTDRAGEILHPGDYEPDNGDYDAIGEWSFFKGFPTNCDVVILQNFDCCFASAGYDDAHFETISIGSARRAKPMYGVFSGDDLMPEEETQGEV